MRLKRKRPQLPPACSACRPYDGAWRVSGDPTCKGALERCDCPRGKALQNYYRGKPRKQAPAGFDGKQAATGE